MALRAQDLVTPTVDSRAVELIARAPVGMVEDGVAANPLIVVLDGPGPTHWVAYSAALGGWQVGFAGTVTPTGAGGFAVAVTAFPAPLAVGVWTVTVYAEDWAGTAGGGNWSFTINAPPVVLGTDPIPGSVEVLADADVAFTATDTDSIVAGTLLLDVTSPSAVVSHPLVGGIWDGAGGFSGNLHPDGGGNFAPVLTHHPDFEPGLWTAYAYAEDTLGASGDDTWVFTVGGMALESIIQSATNSVDVTFDEEPLHLDPSDSRDALHIAAYAVSGPVSPFVERLVWGSEYIGNNTIRLYFDGDLVRDETYTITITGLKSKAGYLLITPAVGSFVAYGSSLLPVTLLQEDADSYDLHNPQVASEAGQYESLGTLSVDETGDLAVENRRSSLRKRVIRRCTTKPGGFAHLTGYGLLIDAKTLLRPSDLRRLQLDAEDQVAREPDVRSVRATVRQILPGVVSLALRVVDRYGPIEIRTLLGGD